MSVKQAYVLLVWRLIKNNSVHDIQTQRRKTHQRMRSCSQIFGLHQIWQRLHSTLKSEQKKVLLKNIYT